jgi:hypothetical protein
MEYEQVTNVVAPGALPWNATIYGLPHPVQPICAEVGDAGGVVRMGMVNPTLTGVATSYSDYTIAFMRLCHSYRMLYHSITVDLDASGLTNSGSVIATQFPLACQVVNVSQINPATNVSVGHAHVVNPNFAQNFPGAALAQIPGSYAGLAQDGLYMPLKLDPGAPWVDTVEAQNYPIANSGTAGPLTWGQLQSILIPGASVPNVSFPWFGDGNSLPPVLPFQSVSAGNVVGNFFFAGDLAVPFQQRNLGISYFYNMNPQARLTVTVRWGVEMRVPPVSTLAPAMKPSCMVDELALTAYSDMAAILPWAYPSSYNGEDSLGGMLKSAWNFLKPVLSVGLAAVPHPAAQAAGTAIGMMPNFERPSGSSAPKAPNKPKLQAPARVPQAFPPQQRRGGGGRGGGGNRRGKGSAKGNRKLLEDLGFSLA